MERNVVRTVTRPFRFIFCEKGVARETRSHAVHRAEKSEMELVYEEWMDQDG